jgi:phosphoglucosamine mutase
LAEKQFFGTDGIRGQVGKAPITADFMVRLGWAAGRVLASGSRRRVIIGKDTRVSGYMFESALEAGLLAAGADVVLLGPLPTPGISALTRSLGAAAGIVISASHNPYTDNGIKFFDYAGEKLDDANELALEKALATAFSEGHVADPGKAHRHPEAVEDYLRFCLSTLPQRLDLSGMTIAVDCAHGATYKVAPELLARLGAKLITIGDQPDGYNINRGVGSTHPGALVEAVKTQNADLGMAFDGDGDRLIMVDHRGELVDGDLLLYVLARSAQAEGHLRGGVVGTVMSNLGLELALNARGVDFCRAQVGDRFVHQMLHEKGWQLGGESSGHLIGLDWHTTGDGLISALHVLRGLMLLKTDLATLVAEVEKCPHVMLNVNVANPKRVSDNAVIRQAIADAEADFGDQGRIIVRASGTEPLVRVTVEGMEASRVQNCAEKLASLVNEQLG